MTALARPGTTFGRVFEHRYRQYRRTFRASLFSSFVLPVLFLVGEYDEARPQTMREFQSRVPGSIVEVIPGAGHASNVDRTAEFNAVLAGFLSSVERRR